jgi:hypothetical protein
MGDIVLIRPEDDASARYASEWATRAAGILAAAGHAIACDVDRGSPADARTILAALGVQAELVCYFGHGSADAWLTGFSATVDANTVSAAQGKSIVSIACHTARALGPDAITAGVIAWFGFTMKVPVIAPHRNKEPIGDVIADSFAVLGAGGSLDELRQELVDELSDLADQFDHGTLRHHPASSIGYYGCLALASHAVVHGAGSIRPLP